MKTSFWLGALVVSAACAHSTPTTISAPAVDTSPYDVIIENGRVVDGTGAAWFYGDVAIRGDRIAKVTPRGMLRTASAKSRIDARNMVVAPGFIDIQDQSGGQLLLGDGRQLGKLTQGVTTGILGEGSTPAPLNPALLAAGATDLTRRFAQPHGFDAWLSAMEAHGISQNVGSFVGAGTIRQYGMAERMGAATGATLDSMRAAVRRAMEDGAFGLASALIYPPNTFATTEELVEEAKAMAPYGGVYITHMRSEADRLLEAVDEVIRIASQGGVRRRDLSSQGRRHAQLEQRARGLRQDRLGARGGRGHSGEHVSVHGRRDGAHVVLAAGVFGRRKVVRQSRERRDAREDSSGGRETDERMGKPL